MRPDAPAAPLAPVAARALSVRGLTIRRGRQRVLEDVSFSAPAGAVTALLGEAGSGKTSLLAGVAGLLKPERGSVWVGATDVTFLLGTKRCVCFLPPGRDLGLRGTLAGALPRSGPARAVLACLGVAGGIRLSQASHGQGFAALAAARLAGAAPVLLLDEAGVGLSDGGRDALFGWLRAQAAGGRTVVIATRDAAVAMQADHLVLLHEGRVLQVGAPASVYAEPRDAAAAMLTGPANILKGTLRQKLPGGFVWVSAGLRFSQADRAGQPGPGLGAQVSICLRPGQLAAAPDLPQDFGPNRVSGMVERLTCREDRIGVLCGSALGPLQAMSVAQATLHPGMDAVLGWSPEAGWVLAP